MMIDLHTHSLFSDGELLPSELARRAEVKGYKAIALTDHADVSNLDFIVPRIVKACSTISHKGGITAVPGIELTHVHPDDIGLLAAEARRLGARLVIVHGETIAEPVAPGTNLKAVEAPIDILAHPGIICADAVKRAAARGIALEITTRAGHSLANGHVAKHARAYGAPLIINSDAHAPEDLVSAAYAEKVALAAGLGTSDFADMLNHSASLVKKACRP